MTSASGIIRRLNDAFRTAGPIAGDWVVTSGVAGLGPGLTAEAIVAVQGFDAFDGDNDPHREHDFGAFDLGGERLYWKIDYYGRDLRFGSENPAGPTQTRRIMTVMLASEY